MKIFNTIFSLTKLIAGEWIRLKFFHIILFLGLLFMAFSHLLSALTFSVQERLLYDFGLGGLELGLILIASLIGSHAIQREIDRKTMFLLLARPIPRSHIVIGAWGAVSVLIFLFCLGFLGALLLTATGNIPFTGLIVSAVCSLQKSMVIAAVALAFGLMVRPMMALVASLSYWVLCYSITDVEFFLKKLNLDNFLNALSVVKKLLPQFYTYNWKSYQYAIAPPTGSEVFWVTMHNFAWISIWLLIGSLVFRKKEVA